MVHATVCSESLGDNLKCTGLCGALVNGMMTETCQEPTLLPP